ncbi:hypothetical protein EhVM1_000087 [Emiliania huxleyi virus M1]|nr:hypothetical protein EhVM1_000087 [Emiliania huxleyi virus M1]
MEKRRLLIVILALVVINIISITMKNYTVAIVFSSLCIAYVLLSMLTSTVMNRRQRARTNPLGDAAAKLHPNPGDTSRIEPRYRAPNVTPDDQDAQPSMAAVDTSLFPRYRAPNVTPDYQDTQPTMRPIRPSIISNLRPTSFDARWSTGSFDEVGEHGDWDLNEKIHGLHQFMKSNNIRGRSSLDLTKPLDKQVNSFLRP